MEVIKLWVKIDELVKLTCFDTFCGSSQSVLFNQLVPHKLLQPTDWVQYYLQPYCCTDQNNILTAFKESLETKS